MVAHFLINAQVLIGKLYNPINFQLHKIALPLILNVVSVNTLGPILQMPGIQKQMAEIRNKQLG